MLKGIAGLTSVFRQGYRLINQVLNMCCLHRVTFQILAYLQIYLTGMTENQIFISSPKSLTLGDLVYIFHDYFTY